jgi:hypothetical protein
MWSGPYMTQPLYSGVYGTHLGYNRHYRISGAQPFISATFSNYPQLHLNATLSVKQFLIQSQT